MKNTTPANTSDMKHKTLKSQAAAFIKQLEKQRAGRTSMLNKVKVQKATPAVLTAPPELQAVFVECVVKTYAKIATPEGGKIIEWMYRKGAPNASAEVVRFLLRRQLPFTDEMLARIFEMMSHMSFLSLIEFNEPLAKAFEKHAARNEISPRLRKAAVKYADAIAVRHVSPTKARYWKEEWGFPRAEDKRVAARMDQVLGR